MNYNIIKPYRFRDEEIFELMDEIYFPKSSERAFPYPELEETAKRAMLLLWYAPKTKLLYNEYSQYNVRLLIREEMYYENLINATEKFQTKHYQGKGVKLLAWLILFEILSCDEVADMQFEFEEEKIGDAVC